MGSVWSRLGTSVTVIEFMDRLCPSMDLELTKKFQTTLKKQKFKFKLKQKVTSSVVTDAGVVLTTEPSAGGESKEETYDIVLVATGRRPYTVGLGLESLGIETDRLGRIPVDEHFRTAVPNIYAIGDCVSLCSFFSTLCLMDSFRNGRQGHALTDITNTIMHFQIDGPMLAHKAEEEGIAAVETIAGFAGHVNYDAIPGTFVNVMLSLNAMYACLSHTVRLYLTCCTVISHMGVLWLMIDFISILLL
jgi:dihydrolipoamide dehydrogenase